MVFRVEIGPLGTEIWLVLLRRVQTARGTRREHGLGTIGLSTVRPHGHRRIVHDSGEVFQSTVCIRPRLQIGGWHGAQAPSLPCPAGRIAEGAATPPYSGQSPSAGSTLSRIKSPNSAIQAKYINFSC